MFIFPEEIKNALDYVFSSSYPLFYKYFYIYICITQYIHPFKDGNGRTSRMILSFCLYKINDKIISRNDKLLSLTCYFIHCSFARMLFLSWHDERYNKKSVTELFDMLKAPLQSSGALNDALLRGSVVDNPLLRGSS